MTLRLVTELRQAGARRERRPTGRRPLALPTTMYGRRGHDAGTALDPAAAGRELSLHRDLDRKSTRLNSSHSQISYAVFCLKKKKTKGVIGRAGIVHSYVEPSLETH